MAAQSSANSPHNNSDIQFAQHKDSLFEPVLLLPATDYEQVAWPANSQKRKRVEEDTPAVKFVTQTKWTFSEAQPWMDVQQTPSTQARNAARATRESEKNTTLQCGLAEPAPVPSKVATTQLAICSNSDQQPQTQCQVGRLDKQAILHDVGEVAVENTVDITALSLSPHDQSFRHVLQSTDSVDLSQESTREASLSLQHPAIQIQISAIYVAPKSHPLKHRGLVLEKDGDLIAALIAEKKEANEATMFRQKMLQKQKKHKSKKTSPQISPQRLADQIIADIGRNEQRLLAPPPHHSMLNAPCRRNTFDGHSMHFGSNHSAKAIPRRKSLFDQYSNDDEEVENHSQNSLVSCVNLDAAVAEKMSRASSTGASSVYSGATSLPHETSQTRYIRPSASRSLSTGNIMTRLATNSARSAFSPDHPDVNSADLMFYAAHDSAFAGFDSQNSQSSYQGFMIDERTPFPLTTGPDTTPLSSTTTSVQVPSPGAHPYFSPLANAFSHEPGASKAHQHDPAISPLQYVAQSQQSDNFYHAQTSLNTLHYQPVSQFQNLSHVIDPSPTTPLYFDANENYNLSSMISLASQASPSHTTHTMPDHFDYFPTTNNKDNSARHTKKGASSAKILSEASNNILRSQSASVRGARPQANGIDQSRGRITKKSTSGKRDRPNMFMSRSASSSGTVFDGGTIMGMEDVRRQIEMT